MKNGRRIILAFFLLLVFSAVVNADMMLVSQEDSAYLQSPKHKTSSDTELNYLPRHSDLTLAGPDTILIEFLTETNINAEQTVDVQDLHIFTNESNSLKFYLSALISLSLCYSVQHLKKQSLGFIPDWFHDGGPIQIGHSHALMPGTLNPLPAYCFIQPDYTEDNNRPRHFIKTVLSLWCKSQSTRTALASRGPPELL